MVVVTGVSGAGKSTALRALEDLGFYCVDNLPLPLVPQFIELLAGAGEIDQRGAGRRRARAATSCRRTATCSRTCARPGTRVEVLFLDASDDDPGAALLRDAPAPPAVAATTSAPASRASGEILQPLREEADGARRHRRTSTCTSCKGVIQERYGRAEGDLAVTLLSFGFKHGLPAEADIVLDVRFLPNPFFVSALSALSGESRGGRALRPRQPDDAREFLEKAEELLDLRAAGLRARGQGLR